MILLEISTVLIALVRDRDLTTQAICSCRRSIHSARQEAMAANCSWKGHLPEDFILKFNRHALIFEHSTKETPFFESCVDIHLPDSEDPESLLPVGRYRLITDMESGEAVDDYLELW